MASKTLVDYAAIVRVARSGGAELSTAELEKIAFALVAFVDKLDNASEYDKANLCEKEFGFSEPDEVDSDEDIATAENTRQDLIEQGYDADAVDKLDTDIVLQIASKAARSDIDYWTALEGAVDRLAPDLPKTD